MSCDNIMSHMAISDSMTPSSNTSTRLYLNLLRSIVSDSDEPSAQEFLQDISVAFLMAEQSEYNLESSRTHDIFDRQDLTAYGTPTRRHLGPVIRQRLLSDIQAVLCSIAEYLCGDANLTEERSDKNQKYPSTLLEQIELHKAEIESLQGELETTAMRISQLIDGIAQNRKDLEDKSTQATDTIFPLHDAARSASIGLLAATIEASLIKLSLVKEQSQRSLYSHRSKSKMEKRPISISDALTAAYASLKEDEKKMKAEISTLDRELLEYESMLLLVDGKNGGYQQIINDWTKVQQETDECLKDLRRLGWTGD